MSGNLLKDSWTNLDSAELRLLLNKWMGASGQYDDRAKNPDTLYLPAARTSCRIALTYSKGKIVSIEPGAAFDAEEWQKISDEIETLILAGPTKIGREYSFNSYRVTGSWRGQRSGVQILPPPDSAPRAPVESAEHPFILEFPIIASGFWPITNHRRIREHRKLTLLLNVLLIGSTNFQPWRPSHFWASVPDDDGTQKIKWVQQFFSADLGEPVSDKPSPPAGEKLQELAADEYYALSGLDGKGLRVSTGLDESICLYLQLSAEDRAKFDRATFWLDVADRNWTISVSSSFAALVSAIEAFTDQGIKHHVYCEKCDAERSHEVPGATARFRTFLETYAPGETAKKQRDQMYSLRSGILHGSVLMQLDQELGFGNDPPDWDERELQRDLWGVTRKALRNWLKRAQAA
jgi:hypothetical protein